MISYLKTMCGAAILLLCLGAAGQSASAAPFQYNLDLQRTWIEQGDVDGVRISLANESGTDITLFRPQFVLRVEGPGGRDQWPIEPENAPRKYRIRNGSSVYIWGSATGYYPVPITSEARAGSYVLQYCDMLRVGGVPQEVCSNRVVLHIKNR